ncbi:UPF0228 family protein [Methanosarcina barkeri]
MIFIDYSKYKVQKANFKFWDKLIICPVAEKAIHGKNFLAILKKNHLQINKFVWCIVRFEDNPKN